MIPKDDYSKAHPQLRTRDLANTANAMLEKVDALRMEAEADGVDFEENPHTGTDIAGDGTGGIRPEDSTVGATGSHHKDGHAVDVFDRSRRFASWCLAHLDRLLAHGLYIEDPRSTFRVHGNHWGPLQDAPPPIVHTVIFHPSYPCSRPLP